MISLELLPATSIDSDRLLELTHAVRQELLQRGEFLPAGWVEEAATDLKRGALVGWVARSGSETVGLGFFSVRGRRAYGHVHMDQAKWDTETAAALIRIIPPHVPNSVERLDVGTTGLSSKGERALGEQLRSDISASVIFRLALERSLTPADTKPVEVPPAIVLRRIRDIPLDSLTELDLRAFEGSPDESLIADSFEEDRRVLGELLGGLLGRFLDEASVALVTEEGALVGALLTGEQSAHTAAYLDLMIEPSRRRKRLGTFLLLWGFRALWALGYQRVRLWVTETNLPARALYARNGFQPSVTAMIHRWDRSKLP